MRDLGCSLVIACVLGCGGSMRIAATAVGGNVDMQSNECNIDATCASGGGHGSLLVPLAVVGAVAVGITALTYVYYLVLPDVRVTTSAPP
jgi:hypothetical protein